MPLPEDFSAWDHLRKQITVAHNLSVEKTFLGVEALDISTELGSMRTATFIDDDDTVDMIVLRLLLYYFIFQGEMQQAFYCLPTVERTIVATGKPQVHLLFREPMSDFLRENKLQQATAQISFRLMKDTALTLNPGRAKEIANDIPAAKLAGQKF